MMNRRHFLFSSLGFAAAGLVLGNSLRGQALESKDPEAKVPKVMPLGDFKPIRRNVGLYTARGGTIGWLASPSALAAVDTQYPETASQFLAGLPGRGGRSLDVVFNTHHHFDHTGGNAVLKAVSADLVAQTAVTKLQLRAAEKAGTLDKQVFARTLFDDVWRKDLGDETISALSYAPAHTGGDAVVIFEKANVVHIGDLVFNRIYPVFDRPGGATIKGWISSLDRLLKECPSDAIYLFGHGKTGFGVTGSSKDIEYFRSYLQALLDHVAGAIKAGSNKDELLKLANMPGFDDFHVQPGAGNRFLANLASVYDELTQGPAEIPASIFQKGA